MRWKTCLGLLLLAASYGQLLVPRRVFRHPEEFFYGYPIVAGNLLAISSALATLGLIFLGEGVCQWFGAPSLLRRVTSDARTLFRFLAAAAVAGVTMEFIAQWVGKLWVYPYWTPWFYWLVVLPGFAFYWTGIVESYLAVKAVLDRSVRPAAARTIHLGAWLGATGAVLLAASVLRYVLWFRSHGWTFAPTAPVTAAPPFSTVLLAFAGALLVAEWALHRRDLPSLLTGLARGYWVPVMAVLISSLILALFLETQNNVNHFWRYTHFPSPQVTFLGVQLSVWATWPLQYVTFLVIPCLVLPKLATQFWVDRNPSS
jgi:hypothetical protein